MKFFINLLTLAMVLAAFGANIDDLSETVIVSDGEKFAAGHSLLVK